MRNHHNNPATYRKDENMSHPHASGYQTKDNPLQEAYMALRRLEEKPDAATADVLVQTRLIAETVRQGAIIEHERILEIDDRSLLHEMQMNASDNVSRLIRAWDGERAEAIEREAALHRTARLAVCMGALCFFLALVLVAMP